MDINIKHKEGDCWAVELSLLDDRDSNFSQYLPIYLQTKCIVTEGIRLKLNSKDLAVTDLPDRPVKVEIWQASDISSWPDNVNMKLMATRSTANKRSKKRHLETSECIYVGNY